MKKYLILPAFSILLCIIISAILLLGFKCRDDIPDFLIYPGSTEIQSEKSPNNNELAIWSFTYVSDSNADEVIAFFDGQITCSLASDNNQTTVCNGNANPYGEYRVYIDQSSEQTTTQQYIIEIWWNRYC